jgi:hypothetical protein
MNKKQIAVTGLVSAFAFASLAFMPASADSLESSARAVPVAQSASMNPMETPQHLVWDMTYGDLAPAEEAVEVVAENTDVTDLSMG